MLLHTDDGAKCDNSYFSEQVNGGMILYACKNGHNVMQRCMCAIEIIISFLFVQLQTLPWISRGY